MFPLCHITCIKCEPLFQLHLLKIHRNTARLSTGRGVGNTLSSSGNNIKMYRFPPSHEKLFCHLTLLLLHFLSSIQNIQDILKAEQNVRHRPRKNQNQATTLHLCFPDEEGIFLFSPLSVLPARKPVGFLYAPARGGPSLDMCIVCTGLCCLQRLPCLSLFQSE